MSQSRSTNRSRISIVSEAAANSPLGIVGAILLHVAIIAATLFTWEHRLDIAQESPPVVPVDLVTIAAKTNIAPTVRPETRITPEPIVQPPPQLDFHPPKVAEEPAPAEHAPPKPEAKPRPEKKKPAADMFQALLNKLAAPSSQPSNAKIAQQTRKGIGAQNAMTMDLVDALRNQIEQCWSPPAGAPHPEQLIVYITLALNPDGSVARPPQLAAQSTAAAADNPFVRAAADAAIRAIYVCSPFKLPTDRYADWRESTIKFDPRDLAGP